MEMIRPSVAVQILPRRKSWNGPSVYIIGGAGEGGSRKFISDFLEVFPSAVHIKHRRDFVSVTFGAGDVLYVQHLVGTEIDSDDIVKVAKQSQCCVIVNIHDWYWLDPSRLQNLHVHYLNPRARMPQKSTRLFHLADAVVYPSVFMRETFATYINDVQAIVSPHIDMPVCIPTTISKPCIRNRCINIGFMSYFVECKGKEAVLALMERRKDYKGFRIKYVIQPYAEDEFSDVLIAQHIHGLLMLNKWAESYCFALTKCLNSGLPCMYNAFGALKERIPSTEPRYFCACTDESQYNDIGLIDAVFCRFLDFIIGQPVTSSVSQTPFQRQFAVPAVYEYLNTDVYVAEIWDHIRTKLSLYKMCCDEKVSEEFSGVVVPYGSTWVEERIFFSLDATYDIADLVESFKRPNYVVLDNKPVVASDTFDPELEKACIGAGFDGVYMNNFLILEPSDDKRRLIEKLKPYDCNIILVHAKVNLKILKQALLCVL